VSAKIGTGKTSINVTWPPAVKPYTMKHGHNPPAAKAVVVGILDGSNTSSQSVTPLAPDPANPGQRGTVLLIPNGHKYLFPWIYISGEQGTVVVDLPPVQGILVIDLPNGMFTDPAEIDQAIDDGTGNGTPPGVGPSGK
jgi:hypothetical protein